jgi:hypothetical protein
METTYAAMLCASGLDMVLMNIQRKETVKTIKAASILKKRGIFSWEEVP